MDSPINRMIDRSSNRKAASSMKAKAKRTKALNDQVLSLVHEANATALPERHVTPRAALIVMARAMKELSSLPEESRNHGVLREVSKFISLNQKTLLASASIKHVDLLPKGHPLSPLNASLTPDELRKKYSEWIAADPAIADEARPLVAMAHSLPPESIEREHAFLRLRTLQASAVPAYFKIDDVTALVAAFSNGNSSAARRARVALQWRDRFGRWIEMGRGVNFRFRMPDGSIATGKGNYVGAGSNPRVERSSSGTSLVSDSGLIEVSGVPGLAPGLYAIDSNNAAAYQARIPGFEAPQAPSFKDQFDADVPSIADLQAARRDLPIGWKKQGPYYVSDDNYAVIPGPNGQPQAVTRLNADGRPAGTVGNARDWSEVNALIEKDQPSFDKEIARIEGEGEEGQLPLARIPGATEEDVVSFDDIANMQKQRAEENKKFDESRPAAKPLGDKDLNGNVVPNSWTRDANDDKAYTRDMPLRDGGTYPLSARVTEDGKYIAGHSAGWIPEPGTDGRGASRKFESWKEIESSIPEFVDYLNEGFTKDNPITLGEEAASSAATSGDLTKIDKSTLDALNKRMREDSTGEYNMEGVTFAPDNNGNIVMYPDAWEPGDKIIGRIEDDGGIDWESDAQYDKYAEKVSEALRGMGGGTGESGARFVEGNSGDVIITNSVKKDPNGAFSEVFMGDYMEPFNTDDPWLDEVVKAANKLGIHVDFAPSQSGAYLSDEGVFRFTLSGPKLTPEQAEEFMGDGPDDAGVFGGAFSGSEGQPGFEDTSWQNLYNALTGGKSTGDEGPDEPPSPGGGTLETSTENIPELSNNPVEVNDPFAVAVSQQYVKERVADEFPTVTLEKTVRAGYNSYMVLNIPDGVDPQEFADAVGLDQDVSDPEDVPKLGKNSYAFYIEFAELNGNLDSPVPDPGDDEEPPTPPSGPGGGTPPKAPSPSTPGSPALFGDFDKPAGAFQLRTTEYEPEGRIDEASTDFTDDPRRLATKFSLEDLVTAFTEALIGRPSDAAMQDILDANVGDDDDLPGLDDLDGVANSPAPRAGEVSGPGAGALEFNAGEEYVQAEALYNAVYEAGGDPNRVIANAYDAVNGNRNNARKLLEAQGGVPSQEESQLIDDMTDEIRQIKDATPDDEISVSQKRSKPDKKFKGSLIENVPVDYNNPDYFDMDTDAYIPSVPEIDENGYTDNPEILALDYFTADLLEQMLEGITDGSGVAILDFGGDQGPGEVPVEALRDALQLNGVNTNDVLFKLRDESNDMSEEEKPTLSREDIRWDAQKGLYTDVNGKVLDGDTVDAAGLDSSGREGPDPDIQLLNPEPTPAAERRFPPTTGQRQAIETPVTPQGPSVDFAPFSDALANLDEEDPSVSPASILMLDDSANNLVDLFRYGIPAHVQIIAYDTDTGIIVLKTAGTDLESSQVLAVHPNGGATSLNADPTWYTTAAGRQFGWEPIPDEIAQAIRRENAQRFPEYASTTLGEPTAPSETPAAKTEAPASPFVYPGPRESGYSVNNTTLASDGSVVGAGSIVTALRDGKRGTVVSIQNDPEYVRIKFDDGKVAVRSANQIKAISNPDGSLALAPSGALAPSAPSPATDVTERLEAPRKGVPNVARSGAAWGINDNSLIPEEIAPYTQEDVPQSKYSAWGTRDAEIANAANTRASFESLFKAAQAALLARDERSTDYPDFMKKFSALLKDAYGDREDLTFGSDKYRVSVNDAGVSYVGSNEDLKAGNVTYQMRVEFKLLDKDNKQVGEGVRYIRSEVRVNADGTVSHDTYVKNEILKVYGNSQKKGFATAYNRYMENWYIANGVEKVKVLAYGGGADWKGGFVWALNGFTWQDPSSALSIARSIERAATTPVEKELARRLRERVTAANGDLSKVPLPIEMALIGWYNGADKWLGKEVMTNVSWDGVKHLDPGAREQKYSVNYDQIRSAERRVRAGQNKANVSANALAQIMDNAFQSDNPELLPHMEAVRDALKNNRPLGFLSPAAKSALNSYVSKQLRDKNSKMPMDDLFRLRAALAAEYSADYDFADPFAGAGDALADFSIDDFANNSGALKEAGFTSAQLVGDERGQNRTFRVTHEPSGQVFFVKEETLARSWNGARGVINEIEANTILNALGMHGIPDVRASRVDEDVFIMSQAGSTLSLQAPVMNADQMQYRGITTPDGSVRRYPGGTHVDALANPEDMLSMAIVDMLGDSEDRHNANWMVAFDNANGQLRMFPIDHGLLTIEEDDDSIASFLSRHWPSAGDVYQASIPRLLELAGEARTKEMFLNQVDKLVKNLDNPLYQPKGEELAALIEKWGSYDAFKNAMKERLTRIMTPGTAENDGLNKAMKRSYWR